MLKPLILPFRVLDGAKGSTIGDSSLLGTECCQDVSGDSPYNLPQQITYFHTSMVPRLQVDT